MTKPQRKKLLQQPTKVMQEPTQPPKRKLILLYRFRFWLSIYERKIFLETVKLQLGELINLPKGIKNLLKGSLDSLQDIIELQNQSERVLLPVKGDCLEGLNIINGGFIAVDFKHFPRPHKKDVCLCYGTFPGTEKPKVYAKVYDGVWGNFQMVSTYYKQSKEKPLQMNCCFWADAIFGVVYASFDKNGSLLWKIDSDIYPTQLQTKPTIRGVGMSDPIRIK